MNNKIQSAALRFVFVLSLLALRPFSSEANPGTKFKAVKAGIVKEDWGIADGKKVSLYTLTNSKGDEVKISDYGGTITSWVTVDKAGNKSNIVIGHDSLKSYLSGSSFFGSTVGRYGNRIGNAQFVLDGITYKLTANNGKNQLHGGAKGFDKVVWDANPIVASVPSLTLNYFSKDGEEGFPGNLKVSVKFTLSGNNELQITYDAQTDKPTHVNLTNHSYFNLTGDVNNTIRNNVLMIDATNFTPVDNTLIPTGEILPVKGTPLDFTTPRAIGERIDSLRGGYDHNFVLNKKGNALKRAAVVYDSLSGRKMEVFTTEPGVQLYTANGLNGRLQNRDGKPLKRHVALCLETQHFPDTPNKPAFPSTVVRPGRKYHSVTTYKVSLM